MKKPEVANRSAKSRFEEGQDREWEREKVRDRVGNREKETERYKARERMNLTVRRKTNRGKKFFSMRRGKNLEEKKVATPGSPVCQKGMSNALQYLGLMRRAGQ